MTGPSDQVVTIALQSNEEFIYVEGLKTIFLLETFRLELTSGSFVPAIDKLDIAFDITSDKLGSSTATISIPFQCGKDDEKIGEDGSLIDGSNKTFEGVKIAKEQRK